MEGKARRSRKRRHFTGVLRNCANHSPAGPRGATVARLTPDQKVACSNHVGVTVLFFGGISFSSEISFSGGKKKHRVIIWENMET